MKSKLLDDGLEKTWALIMDSGDEAASSLASFAHEKNLRGSHLTAIGGFSRATLGYYDWETKTYLKIPIHEQVEVLSLIGDIAMEKSEPKVHVHVVVGLRDGSTRGGHLLEGVVRPTLEIVIAESPKNLEKKFDPASQLTLIAL
jgi:predicted DNA-binding protein with PD1-like motif